MYEELVNVEGSFGKFELVPGLTTLLEAGFRIHKV